MSDPAGILNSLIRYWANHPHLKPSNSQQEPEPQHVLFMTDDRDRYEEKMMEEGLGGGLADVGNI